jgi:DNA-directed RNA polymerase
MKIDNEDELQELINKISDIRKQLLNADKEASKDIYHALSEIREQNKEQIREAAPLYWKQITEPNERRKLCKRGVMTMVYGVTRYGAGEQIIEDVPKHGIAILEGMDRTWAIWLGQVIYDTMFEAMPTSAALLKLFEIAGKRKGNVNKSLSWRTPLVNFPVVQDYRVNESVTVKTQFYNETLNIKIKDPSVKRESPSKQKTGAPPNIVHSLDAAHLMLTSEFCKEPLVTVHDSFGTLAGGMQQLHSDVRTTFVMLYYDNPLPGLLRQLGIDDLEVKLGNFDMMEVLNAEYCFL